MAHSTAGAENKKTATMLKVVVNGVVVVELMFLESTKIDVVFQPMEIPC